MPPFAICDLGMVFALAELSRRVKLEKKLDSFDFVGIRYGSASSASSWCVFKAAAAGEAAGLADGCAGAGPERSGVACCEDENLELMLVIHEVLLPPVLASSSLTLRCEPDRPKMFGLLECCFAAGLPLLAAGVGVEGAAGAVFFAGSEIVGGVTTAGE